MRQAHSVIVLLLLVACGQPPGRAQDRTASCRAFVAEFYRWYPRATERGGFDVALKRRRASFSSELARRLNEDSASQARTPGEITGLDFDPFLNAQDVARSYTVGRVSQRGGRYFASVYADWNGKRETKPAVTPELIFAHGRWTFINFHYGPKLTDDLLSDLAQYRRERSRPHK